MPKRHTGVKHPRDPAQLAKLIVDIATGEVDDRERTPEDRGVDPAASAMGRKGFLPSNSFCIAVSTSPGSCRGVSFGSKFGKFARYAGRYWLAAGCAAVIARDALLMQTSRIGTHDQRRIGGILTALKWIPFKSNGKRGYKSPAF
jgi:hypothetical protein